jgi:hypothetical protein
LIIWHIRYYNQISHTQNTDNSFPIKFDYRTCSFLPIRFEISTIYTS